MANYNGNGNTGNVIIVSTTSNTVTGSINAGLANPTSVAFSPGGSYAYVVNYQGNVNAISTATNTLTNYVPGVCTGQAIAFSPSGTYAYTTTGSCNQNDSVTVINTATNTIVANINATIFCTSTGPSGIAISPNGKYAYVGNSGSVVIVNIYTSTTNSINSEAVVSPALGTPTLTPTPSLPSTQAAGNTITFAASWSGGTSTYTANYLITNTITGNLVANMLFTGITGTTNSFAWTIPTADIGNTLQANVIITDSASTPETTNSVKTGTLTVVSAYTPPPTPTLSSCPSASSLDVGQTISCTASVSGGTGPYTYNWLVVNSGTDAVVSNMLFTGVSSTSNTFTYTTQSVDTANSPLAFNVIVTDSHPTTVNSVYSSTFTVNPALSTPTISPSNPTVTNGQSVTFSSSWSGGTPTYGASLYASTTSACNQESTLVQQDIGLSTGSATFSPVTPSQPTYYCVFVTDNTLNSYSLSAYITSGFSSPDGVAFSPSGTYAYVADGTNVVIINTATNTVIGSVDSSGISYYPRGVAFSPSGTYAYVADGTNVVIINTATNTVTGSINSGFNTPYGVAFSPSGTYAYVANYNGDNVAIINTATNTVTGSITPGFSLSSSVSFSPSGTYAYLTNSAEYGNVVIINTATNTVTGTINNGFVGLQPYWVAFSPSGTYAYVTTLGNINTAANMVIINTATNTVVGSITSGFDGPVAVAISPSGTYAYVTNYNSNNVVIINTGVLIANSINSEVTLTSSASQVSNPYAGGATGYFGPNSTLSSSTTSTISSSSTSTILPVTTITPITASPGTTNICNDTSGYTINYPSLNATIKIAPGTGCFRINVTNSTLQSKALNKSVITALNYTVNNTNVSADIILHYSCSIPNSDVAPFILRNGTWQEITPFILNAAACTVEFAVPSDPVIALLNTNVTSTITTTSATTTVQAPVTTVPAPQQNNSTILILILVIIVIIVIAALFIYMRNKR